MTSDKLQIGYTYGVNNGAFGPIQNNLLILVDINDEFCTFFNFTNDSICKIALEDTLKALETSIPNSMFIDETILYKLEKLPDDVFGVVKANMEGKKTIDCKFKAV